MILRRRHRTDDPPPGRPTPAGRRALIETAHAAYADWREESRRVASLYRRWSESPGADRARRFAAYAAALDREQRAAQVYAAVLDAAAER